MRIAHAWEVVGQPLGTGNVAVYACSKAYGFENLMLLLLSRPLLSELERHFLDALFEPARRTTHASKFRVG